MIYDILVANVRELKMSNNCHFLDTGGMFDVFFIQPVIGIYYKEGSWDW